MSEKGHMVSVRSGVLFGGWGLEGGRDIEVDTYCGTPSAVSIFLADAVCVRGAMKTAGRGGMEVLRVSGRPRTFQRAYSSQLL